MQRTLTALLLALCGGTAIADAAWYYHADASPWIYSEDTADWIYFPDRAPYAWSANGQTWMPNPLAENAAGPRIILMEEYPTSFSFHGASRTISVSFKNDGTCSVNIDEIGSFSGQWKGVLSNAEGEAEVFVWFTDAADSPSTFSLHLDYLQGSEGTFTMLGNFAFISGPRIVSDEGTFVYVLPIR